MKVTSFGAEYSNGDDHQLSNTATIQILRGLKVRLRAHGATNSAVDAFKLAEESQGAISPNLIAHDVA